MAVTVVFEGLSEETGSLVGILIAGALDFASEPENFPAYRKLLARNLAECDSPAVLRDFVAGLQADQIWALFVALRPAWGEIRPHE